jgi:polyisoprenoid-binding protein YceI
VPYKSKINMKKANTLLAAAAIIAVTFTSCTSQEQPKEETQVSVLEDGNYMVNMNEATVIWKGEMVGMYSHEGTIVLNNGVLIVENGQVTGGKFNVDMTTINPTDDAYNPEEGRSRDKLVEHLSSPDFFDTNVYNTATFYISEVMDGKAKGQLTVRGITHEEVVENLTVQVQEDGTIAASGVLTFDRQKYEVAFTHPLQEMVVSDKIQLEIKLVASKG